MYSISQWWASLARHWIASALSLIAVIAATVLIILYSPREYRSTSRLLLRVGPESATLDPTVTVTGDPNAPLLTRENEVETAIDVMHSRSILEEVVDQLGPELILSGDLPSDGADQEEKPGWIGRLKGSVRGTLSNIDPVSSRETAVRALRLGMGISGSEKSALVTVEYVCEHPKVAQSIVLTWVDTYLRHHARVNRTEGAYAFFLDEDAVLLAQLDEVHRQLREAKSRAGFVTLEGQQKLLEAQLETVRSELLKTEADLVESSTRAETYGDLLASAIEKTITEEVSGIASGSHEEMRGLLFELEILENEYAAKFTDSHPKLVAVREQLAKASQIVNSQDHERKEYRQTVNPTHQQVFENRILDIALEKSLRERREALKRHQEALVAEINALNQHEEKLARLTRNADVLEERHKLHAVLLEQARLNEVLEEKQITSINVVQPASLEQRPVSPDKKMCAASGLLAAIVLALGLPVLLDWRLLVPTESGRIASDSPVSDSPIESIRELVTEPKVSSPVLHRENHYRQGDDDHDADTRIGAEPLVQEPARPR